MVSQTTIMLLVGGMFFGMIAAQITESMFRKAAALLDPATREKLYQHEMKMDLVIRILDIVSFGVLICGVVQLMNRFPAIAAPNIHWGSYAMAAGNILGAFSLMVQGWNRCRGYGLIEDAKPGQSQARTAFIAVVVFELIWIGLIAFLAWKYFPPLVGPVKNSPTRNSTTNSGSGGNTTKTNADDTPAEDPESKLWTNQAEALKILGKDADYLDMLVKLKEVKTKKNTDGTVQYFRNHIDTLKQSGLPGPSELKERLTELPPEPPPPPPPPKDEKSKNDREILRE